MEVVDLDIGTLILLWMSEHSAFKLLPFHLIDKVFGVTLLGRHLRLKIVAVLYLASCIFNFSNFLLPVDFHDYRNL